MLVQYSGVLLCAPLEDKAAGSCSSREPEEGYCSSCQCQVQSTLTRLVSGFTISSHAAIMIGRLGMSRPEDDRRPVLRVEEHQDRRCVEVAGRQPEVEALEDDGHGKLGLEERQVLADAHPGAEPERDERRRVRGGLRHAPGEPRRVELRGIGAPQFGVVVQGHDRDQQLRVARDQAPAELHVGLGAAHRRHRRRVQPERLVQDHPELPVRPQQESADID